MSRTRQTADIVSKINVPQLTEAQRDAGSFVAGAIIYNTTSTKLEFYNCTSWVPLPGMSLGLTVALDG